MVYVTTLQQRINLAEITTMVKELIYPEIRKASDFRIEHMKAFANERLEKLTKWKAMDYIEFIHDLSGNPIKDLMNVEDFNEIVELCNHYARVFSKIKVPKEPKQELTINGKEYELVNIAKPNTAWVVDQDVMDLENDPVKMACLCYVPKGTKYGETDDNGELLYPISDRYDDFKEHFELQDFIALQVFFLSRYIRSTKNYIQKVKAEVRIRRMLKMFQRSKG